MSHHNAAGVWCELVSGRRRCCGRGSGGFTLIELLVVIGIIAVLAAIIIPVYSKAREKARQSQCIANMHAIAVAIKMYHMDYHDYPPAYNFATGTGGISALYAGEYLTDTKALRCPNDQLRDFNDYSALYRSIIPADERADFDARWSGGVAIDDSPGGAVRSSGVVTITTTSDHGLVVGQQVVIASVTSVGGSDFNGTFVVASVPSTTSFTYAQSGPNDTGGEGSASPAGARYFLEHYSSYNLDTTIDPDADDDEVVDDGIWYDLNNNDVVDDGETFPKTFVLYNYNGYDETGHEKWIATDPPSPRSGRQGVKYPRLKNRWAPDETIITHCPYHRDYFGGSSSPGAQDIVVRLGGGAGLEQVNTRPPQDYWIDQLPD